ncbi:hypothetical protein [Bordetella trematum]|nr:hypothetical protein [Bordetella trematum]
MTSHRGLGPDRAIREQGIIERFAAFFSDLNNISQEVAEEDC